LPQDLVDHYGLELVPLSIRFGDEQLSDRFELDATSFWKRVTAGGELPSTAAPGPGEFRKAYETAAQQGFSGVCSITISGALSATVEAARAAAQALGKDFPVRVVDSRSITLGQGLIVLEAAEKAAQGASLDEISDLAESLVSKVHVYGALDTLSFLRRGGRIGGAQAFLGTLLSIKPVIVMRDGAVEAESRQRTRSKALHYLASKVSEHAPVKRLGVVHANATDLSELLDALRNLVAPEDIVQAVLGPVIGTHSGPGTVGVCILSQ